MKLTNKNEKYIIKIYIIFKFAYPGISCTATHFKAKLGLQVYPLQARFITKSVGRFKVLSFIFVSHYVLLYHYTLRLYEKAIFLKTKKTSKMEALFDVLFILLTYDGL